MEQRKLDILIPHYKEDENTIKYLLDSIKNQLFVDFENNYDLRITIVNDGPEVVLRQKFLDSYPFPIDYLVLEEHVGVSAVRNKLFDITTGEYILYFDADDFIPSTIVIREVLDAITNARLLEKNDRPNLIASKEIISLVPENDTMTFGTFSPFTFLMIHGLILSRDFLVKNKIRWNTDLYLYEDFEFSQICYIYMDPGKENNTILLKNHLYTYFRVPGSVTKGVKDLAVFSFNNFREFHRARCSVVDRLIQLGDKNRLEKYFGSVLADLCWHVAFDFEQKFPKTKENEANWKEAFSVISDFKNRYKIYLDEMASNGKLEEYVCDSMKNAIGITINSIAFRNWFNSI